MMIDFLIVGQGLAGSLLAWELIQRGCSVLVVDNGNENASQIAAGLINPVTGMRFAKSGEVDTLLPAARNCYSELATFFHQVFFIEKTMMRIFSSEKELNAAVKRVTDPDYQAYLNNIYPKTNSTGDFANPFGYVEQKQTGYLLTRPLLDCLKSFLISRNSYRLAGFDYKEIAFNPTLNWRDVSPREIIFCEGHQAIKNPWFSWLPFQPVKGEILTMNHHTELPDKIINYGNWLIPLNTSQIRIGATFDREKLNTQTTEAGKNELLMALSKISPGLKSSTVISHEANIRPCTRDRRPFIGRHRMHHQLSIFNGFGAKGSLQIPWYSQRFADALLDDAPLPSSCNIRRHYKDHFAD
ncbi:MAG TPA: FAD-binding oxidoreductase [Prolixibacteraceae bacterium]|nr:FAD-binding oxidoreductase [Prolixibacteraceae bacterium]